MIIARLAIVSLFVALFVWGFFLVAGRWDWIAGWRYVGLLFAASLACDLAVWRANPDLLRRRGRFGAGTKRWDLVCLALFGVFYLAMLVVGALDGGRYGWAPLPGWLWPLGAALILASLAVLTWCMLVNPHFEKAARIQSEIGHAVIRAGPYAWVRHPGYTALILGYIPGPPLMLGSAWALAPAALAVVVIVVRTALEDRMLMDELPGYRAYAAIVRYRLAPGIW